MSQLLPFLHDEALPPSRNDRSRIRRVVALVGVTFLVACVTWAGLTIRSALPDESAAFTPGIATVVVVQPGDSLTSVGQRLTDAGVVGSVSAFLAAAELDERAATIGPGVYNMVTGLAASEAIDRLVDAAFREPPLVLREGLRLRDTLAVTSASTGIAESELLAAVSQPTAVEAPTWSSGQFEGLLFPATYTVLPGATADDVISDMVDRFNVAATETNLVKKSQRLGFTPYEVLTVASLIEAEAAPSDFRKVARVIYNRLAINQRLELDSTINYALGTTTLIVTEEMLQTDSAYNTYRNAGLPPTPINSPGQAAIEAALKPANGDWLYFVTVNPAERITRFTASYEKFLELKAQFQRNYAEQVAAGILEPAG